MSELANIFGGGAEHAHEQQAREKILPAPAPISADAADDKAKVPGVDIPAIGLPGEAVVYEPFKLEEPEDDETPSGS
jgi:hypothetical protein